jgi:hypothetical protein
MPQEFLPARREAENIETKSIDDAKAPCVQKGVAYWRSLCGQRRFPARADLTLRGMAPILPHSVIIEVIDRGADYEYRYVGDIQRQAFKTYFKGIRVTQIEAVAPRLGGVLRAAYEHLRSTGMPFIVRGEIDPDLPSSMFLYHETAFLPLGADDGTVDHLLIVGVQVPEPFWEIPLDKLNTLRDANREPTVLS